MESPGKGRRPAHVCRQLPKSPRHGGERWGARPRSPSRASRGEARAGPADIPVPSCTAGRKELRGSSSSLSAPRPFVPVTAGLPAPALPSPWLRCLAGDLLPLLKANLPIPSVWPKRAPAPSPWPTAGFPTSGTVRGSYRGAREDAARPDPSPRAPQNERRAVRSLRSGPASPSPLNQHGLFAFFM